MLLKDSGLFLLRLGIKLSRIRDIKKAKKSRRPRTNTGSTHHWMKYRGDELFSCYKITENNDRVTGFNIVF